MLQISREKLPVVGPLHKKHEMEKCCCIVIFGKIFLPKTTFLLVINE